MGSQRQSGVKPDIVKKILAVLEDAKAEVDKVVIMAPPPGMLGSSPHAVALLGDMTHATRNLELSMSAQSEALIQFGQVLADAQKAIENADDDSADHARVIQTAVDTVTRRLHDEKGKDDRPSVPVVPFLPGLGPVLQDLASRAQFEAGVEQ